MVEASERNGQWIALADGRPWYPLDPRPDEVTVEVIAHHLGNICRYTGATRWHYPVGQHAVLVCRWLRSVGHGPLIQMQALHHDDPEALSGFGDIVRPVKRAVPAIGRIEDNIWNVAIAPKFGLPLELDPVVIDADLRICADEKKQVLEPTVLPWKSNPEPLGGSIRSRDDLGVQRHSGLPQPLRSRRGGGASAGCLGGGRNCRCSGRTRSTACARCAASRDPSRSAEDEPRAGARLRLYRGRLHELSKLDRQAERSLPRLRELRHYDWVLLMGETWNVVAIDNLARDYNGGRSEWLIGTAFSRDTAELFANAWNDKWCHGDIASDYAVVRPASEPLYVFEGY